MTKLYELPNGHRMVADIDESTRVCNITETTLDSLVSKLNYYAEQTDVLDKIRADRDRLQENIKALGEDMRICQKSITDEKVLIGFNMAVALCNKHLAESEE